MAHLRRITTALSVAVTGIVALLAAMLAAPAGASLEDGTCPPSVDSQMEGWICSMLLLNTPTDSPTDAQIDLWSEVLAEDGREAVAEGIVFSDASVEAKVKAVYGSELDREPEPDGLAHWRAQVQFARSEYGAEFGIFASGEYLSQFESVEAFVNDQYRYYLGREASRDEQAYWAERFVAGDLSNEDITRAVAQSAEAREVRAHILYDHYVQRMPETEGLQHWAARTGQGLFPTIVEFSVMPEAVATLGTAGLDRAESGSDAAQDLVVAPQEVVTTAPGEPVEISVLGQRGGDPIEGPLDLTLFPCENVAATDSPVPFADADDDDLADGIASTADDQAYISEVNGEPTGGRTLYVDDAEPADDGVLRFEVIAGPSGDCAVIAAIDDGGTARELDLDSQDHADEPFGVTQVIWS